MVSLRFLGLSLLLGLLALPAPAQMKPLAPGEGGVYRFGPCHAQLKGDRLTLGNGEIERKWRVREDGGLEAISFKDLKSGQEWLKSAQVATDAKDRKKIAAELTATAGQAGATEESSIMATLRVKQGAWVIETRLQVFADTCGVLMDRAARPAAEAAVTPLSADLNALETLDVAVPSNHAWTLTRVEFLDQTDRQAGPLVNEKTSPAPDPTTPAVHQPNLSIYWIGNLFFIEDEKAGAGLLFLKHAPLPGMRPMAQGKPTTQTVDLIQRESPADSLSESAKGLQLIRFQGNEITSAGGHTYRWVTLAYQGGRAGRIAALQTYYRQLRKYDPTRDGLLLTNTWGDRSKDGRVSEAFMKKEIDAAARLGVDVTEIDDGWQKGTTMNSVKKGGVWNGFYAKDADFWAAHPDRFPGGIKPLSDYAKTKGIQFGLWFAPDSSGDFQNWQKDRDLVLGMHRERGVNYFKFDGIKMHSRAGEANVHKLVGSIIEGSQGRVTIDLDVTAEVRPGYFGIPNHGPIFVENRYTDSARPNGKEPANTYWPHKTLRNFWLLAQYVDPIRLRMEFLNNQRNAAKYDDSPLAPAKYSPDTLFAAVMFGSPLGWFETQNLPAAYFEKVAPLVKVWKANREAIFNGSIIPVGAMPDGQAWTGLVSVSQDRQSAYALVFRELNEKPEWTVELPLLAKGSYTAKVLAGDGKANVSEGKLSVELPGQRSYLLVRIER